MDPVCRVKGQGEDFEGRSVFGISPLSLGERGMKDKVDRRHCRINLGREKFHVNLLGVIEIPVQQLCQKFPAFFFFSKTRRSDEAIPEEGATGAIDISGPDSSPETSISHVGPP